MRTLRVTSHAFGATEAIPIEYTCDGGELSPPLAWSKGPDGTKSFAILIDDPDAPGGAYTHWLVTNIPADVDAVEAGVLPSSAVEGLSDSGMARYAGPCPPSGRHHYYFHVYALDVVLDTPPMTRAEFLAA